jgi:hypothetical protein
MLPIARSTADQFLTLLAEGAEEFTFQTFDDNKSCKDCAINPFSLAIVLSKLK